MKSCFRVALALWLSPDFAPVLAGKMKPPHINHSKIDFAALLELLTTTFHYGPPVTIRLPNDTIDQVTLHKRETSRSGASIRCEDFGSALLACAKKQDSSIIDVRSAWQSLHALPDRDFSPPPILLPFVIEAADFEDAMIWSNSAKVPLGLPFAQETMRAPAPADDNQYVGTLPDALHKGLSHIFGCPFENSVLIDRMAMDKPPALYGL